VAHSLSAKKRVRQNAKRRTTNRARKSVIKTQIKHFLSAVSGGEIDKAGEQFGGMTKKLDKSVSTGSIHKNTASRIKSRMARRLNSLRKKAGSA
jgi:small subunit ribosomal protein S20